MRAIELCRTEALGGHLYVCDKMCGRGFRSITPAATDTAPKCQCLDKERWLEARVHATFLPVGYFHVGLHRAKHATPTFPRQSPACSTACCSRRPSENAGADRRRSSASRSTDRVPRHLAHLERGPSPLHPHINYVVPAGGLSPDG